MAIGFNQFSVDDYNFDLRFYNQYIPSTSVSQVMPTTMLYDTDGWYMYNTTGFM